MTSLKEVVEQGKRRESLVALRDLVAARLDEAEPQYVAALAKQLRDVLADLDALKVPEVSAVDELKAKRSGRRGTASVQDGSAGVK